MKGDFQSVMNWFNELCIHSTTLAKLIEIDEDPIAAAINILNIVKAGFYSKSIEVTSWTYRLLSKRVDEFSKRNLMTIFWEWFLSNDGGLEGLIYSYNKNKKALSSIVVFFI